VFADMTIFDQMRHLEMFLVEEHNRGRKLSDLCELVQFAGNIIPRLYLLITGFFLFVLLPLFPLLSHLIRDGGGGGVVGAIYIETKEAPTREIFVDLVEMCRGVQHPTRGLFLRNYFSQMIKNQLSDVSKSMCVISLFIIIIIIIIIIMIDVFL